MRLFGNVWFGVIVLALLFIFCSIGSAVPHIRQLPSLEMTEFEWFHWWPFDVLVALFCVGITTTTIWRIPLRLVNAGVWTIHVGIVTLVLGCYIYFGTKVEGDVPVFRRQVQISLPGMDKPETLVALPGSRTRIVVGSDVWRFAVQSTNTDWPILSEEHKGERAYAVNVAVTPPTGEPFIRQILDGYPQYTEDVIPGQGRAIKTIGRKLVKEDLDISLDYKPATHFHVMDTWALFSRRAGSTDWIERPIEGLPRYNDHVASRDQVFVAPGEELKLRSLDLEVAPGETPDPIGGHAVRISGYLRNARWENRWREGGDRLNPVLAFTVSIHGGQKRSFELVAFDRKRSQAETGSAEFRWLEDASQMDSLPNSTQAMVRMFVPSTGDRLEIPLTRDTVVGREGAWTPIDGTELSYRIAAVQDHLSIPSASTLVSIAMVEVKTPEGKFTRMVADHPEMTKDMHGDSSDPHSPHGRTAEAPDPRIVMTYHPRSATYLFVAHPQGAHLIVNGDTERQLTQPIQTGDTVQMVAGHIHIDTIMTHAVAEAKPFIVPKSRRNRSAGETFSMIRLELGEGAETRWVRFNHYAFPDARYSYSGRFSYTPTSFKLADGSHIEVLFSRQRRALPYPIALEEFSLDTHAGGYTGSVSGIKNYVSRLLFLDDGLWSQPRRIAVNQPTGYGGFWYFQSQWDKPTGGPGSGMNYTGLGVGNRNGVHVQLAGCCIAIAGMIFAFYVKPVLQRRRYARSRAEARHSSDSATDVEDTADTQSPVGVQV